MNILFICDEFPPGKTGGIGIATEQLAKGLVGQGHKVFVVGLCVHGYGAADHEVRKDGIEVWRLRYNSDRGWISNKDRIIDKVLIHALRWTGLLAKDAAKKFSELIARVQQIIENHQIDVVEIADWNNFFFNLRPQDFNIPKLKAPLLVKMHGSFSYLRVLANGPENKHFRQLEDRLYARADHLAAVSKFTANTGREIFALRSEIAVLYNGIRVGDFKEQNQRSNSNQVLFSGSLLPNKGIYQLIKAWPLVIQKFPDASLHIYGKGNQIKIRQEISKELEQTVFLHGHIAREELLYKLEKADLAVFPSFSETFGMAAAEAMAVGCPVIFTKRTSGPEVVTDLEEGWLVDPANSTELAEVICLALSSPETRERFAKAAYQKVLTRFSLDAAVRQHEEFYTGLRNRFKNSPS